ncbi:hypothetical protein [Anaeromyxobacter diazotrophicus]|uniref:DUF1440 domain-containing protein n=1 Tax=Anaeromyxobacter diazotrophicus TaxID=2590199 RepID=A0A7I9VHY8_9BACT|nr:hypothetical protein [Anaeromyxobacter diazotrophicus]GEJ56023.1 hypothetical protein AMYX_07640 [Anaeromyxobacter diazotrophicus]
MGAGGAVGRGWSGRAGGLAAEIAFAGGVAGTLAGAAMALFFALLGTWRGLGWLGVLQGIGGVFYGWAAMGAGPPAFWGLVLHFAVSVALGVLFAAIVRRNAEPLASVTAGLMFGLAVWAVMTWVVIRVIDRPLADVVDHMAFGWLAAHVVFGLVLGLASQLRGIAAGEEPPRRH